MPSSKSSARTYCPRQADKSRGLLDPTYFSGAPVDCDLCGQPIRNGRYFSDCEVPNTEQWGYLCEDCTTSHKIFFGWGIGQLYERLQTSESRWLLVAGFPDTTI